MFHVNDSTEQPMRLLTTAPLAYLLDSMRAGTLLHAAFARRYFYPATNVCDLLAGLYHGLAPFCITMQRTQGNSNVHPAKGGEPLLLIDGKRRLAALLAALYRAPLPDADRDGDAALQIAFHPQTEVFRRVRPGARLASGWLPDVAALFKPGANLAEMAHAYCVTNSNADPNDVHQKLKRVQDIPRREIQVTLMSSQFTEKQMAIMFKRMNSRFGKR